ncbi:GIN domain-containing protein [Pedobacter glucosidilyticus]|uniref:GIN domain-containing protein n=1 Tax=Pedobacter glucosidilyticus TaxID=1122941 RepID=UPI0026F1C990|nr:DUF2807 domain-containing protein [Pedobacter glucosidilyticus]
MNNLNFNILILLILAFTTVSCRKDRVEANKNIVTEERNLSGFHSIRNSGATEVFITYGNTFKIELRGSSNLIPYFKTRLLGNTLHLGYQQVNVEDDDLKVYITMPVINGIALSGSGDAELKGDFPEADALTIDISGSADFESSEELLYHNVKVNISGSGDVKLPFLQCNTADVNISGSGNTRLKVQDHLKVRISGSGKVYYTGSPQIDSKVSGSGGAVKVP